MNDKIALLILAPGFEEIEALATADILRRLNCNVLLCGLNDLTVTGSHNITVTADVVFDNAPVDAADVIILPGGLPGATNLRDSEKLIPVLRQYHLNGKHLAAICAAPIVLKFAGIADDAVMTGYPGCEPLSGAEDLRFTGKMVECDNGLITGKGPGATPYFAAAIARHVFGVDDDAISNTLSGMFIA